MLYKNNSTEKELYRFNTELGGCRATYVRT